ncbi:MAG: hypothetical protein ABJH57_16670 [Cyclobacteriaceae bacterium]
MIQSRIRFFRFLLIDYLGKVVLAEPNFRMNRSHLLVISALIIIYPSLTSAQQLNLIGRANIGIGFDYISQDFKGLTTFYSPGGGMGLEAGLEGEIQNDLYWYGTLGFTYNLNFHYEEINGQTTKTAFSWNKIIFTGGVNKYFDIRNKYIANFYGGGGLMVAIPGTLRRTINSTYQGRIGYKPNLGLLMHGGATLTITDNFLLRPEIRYRYINFKAESFTRGDVSSLESGLKKARGTGLDISVTIVKTIKGGSRSRR